MPCRLLLLGAQVERGVGCRGLLGQIDELPLSLLAPQLFPMQLPPQLPDPQQRALQLVLLVGPSLSLLHQSVGEQTDRALQLGDLGRGTVAQLVLSLKASSLELGLEGAVAKRLDGLYDPGSGRQTG